LQILKSFLSPTLLVLSIGTCSAAQLSSDAKSAIPRDVQQIISVDYRAMQNSSAAMELKDRVLPPELKRLETALKTSGLKVDQDADVLTFAAFRDGSSARYDQRDACCRAARCMESPGSKRNTDDDAFRSGRRLTAGGLRYSSEPDEELTLHDGFPEWREVRHGGRYG